MRARATVVAWAIAGVVFASATQIRERADAATGESDTANDSVSVRTSPRDDAVNSMAVEDTSLWEDTDDGSFVFHDNRSGTTNDPVPEAWNIYGQPLEFDAVTVYADGGVQVDIDTVDDSRASVSSALDPTVRYVIRLSSGDASVTVVHEGDIGDVKIVPDNAAEVREFHGRLAAGTEGTAVVSDAPPEPPDEVVNSMRVEDASLWEDTDDGSFVFHDNRPGTTNDPVPEAWNIYGQPLEFDAATVYADGGVQIDIDTEDDSRASVSSALDPTVRYVIRLSSGDASVTVVHEGDIGDVKIVPDNAAEVREFHDRLAAGADGTAVVSDDPAPAPADEPDLVVESVSASDPSPSPGAAFTLSATVRNSGGAAAAATTLRYYRSENATISTSDTAVGTDAVGALSASATSPESISLNAPNTAGTYYYGACVDAVAGESDTADNCSAVRVDVQAPPPPTDEPDLVVESVSASDSAPQPGAAFTLRATVRNSGDAAAGATTLRYYRSENATISTSDTAVGTDAVGALSASATSPESISLNAPNTAGTYYYGACVDAVANESDTADNCSASVRVDVQAPPPPPTDEPDLVVESVSASDSAPQPGAAFTLRATVRNSGDAAAGATTLRYYRSENATISTSDTAVGTDAVGALSASATSPESISLNAPNTAGTYYYGACVDAVANESDTADNCSASVRVDVQAPPPPPPTRVPDLVVESVSASDSAPQPGATLTLRATVRNSGDAAAAATTLRYYRSADATIGTSDTAVGTDAVGALSASATSPESISLNAPNTAGTYYYGACVDAVAGESDTADNCSASVRVDVQAPPPPPPSPPAPTLSLNAVETDLEVRFDASFAARERKAYRIRIRQKTQHSDSRTYCFTATNTRDRAVATTIIANISVASFTRPNTTYLVDYRYLGASCSDTATDPWSGVAEFTTTGLTTGGDFNIDVVFVAPEPSSAVKSAVNSAASLWEQAIASDIADIDFSGRPISDGCTDGAFGGVVDDLRVYVRVQSIDGAEGVLGAGGICAYRSQSRLPVIARITLDSADVGQLGSGTLYNLAVHEMAHALGFGILWGGLLVNPSLSGGQPVTPPPDTHFAGSNAVAAFNDAGGTNYQGGKVPVENEHGGRGSQDSHWRDSAMRGELMTYRLGSSDSLSAITIQSMADLGYTVDDSVADSYTLSIAAGQAAALAAGEDEPQRPRCVVYSPTGLEIVPESASVVLPASAIQMRIIDDGPVEM